MCLVLFLIGLRSAVLAFIICFSADGLHEARLRRAILCWTVSHDSIDLLAIDVLFFLRGLRKRYGVVMRDSYIHDVRR